MSILDALSLTRLRFEMEAQESAEVPAYKGNLLRMALLWWLSEFWCPEPTRCRHGCRRPDVCMFGRLCQPAVDPTWSAPTRHLVGNTPSPAYALWDYRDRRRHFRAGDNWRFELVLIGTLALRQIPAIVAAIQEGGEQGMGRIRWRNRIQRVTALDAGDGGQVVAEAELVEGRPVLTWQGYRLEEIGWSYAEARAWAEHFTTPVRHLTLHFLSPLKIKERGSWVREPQLSSLLRALVRRLRILSEVHGTGPWPHAEYGPLLDLAEEVELEHHETQWESYPRRSQRSGRYDVEGLLGRAWYRGADLRPLLPVLWLGQWLHVSKGYVLGNGRYRLEV